MYEKFLSVLKANNLNLINWNSLESIHSNSKVSVECLNCLAVFKEKIGYLMKFLGCPSCGKGRLTAEQVYKKFQDRGIFLDTTTYVNTSTKAYWECSYGHRWLATPKSIHMGRGCPNCAGNQKHDYKAIKTEVESEGFKLLSNEYVNARTPLTIECRNGHIIYMAFQNFKRGSRCKMCNSDKRKHGIEKMKKLADERGGQCLSEHYVDSKTKLKWMCKQGHVFESRPTDVLKGKWCPVDAGLTKGGQIT